jgi:hypothetical protein
VEAKSVAQSSETLKQLLERRLGELGSRRGRGEKLSLREAWLKLPEKPGGGKVISYETARRIREDGHQNISDETADAIALMLKVKVDEVLLAAGQRKRLGRFELPRRADRLTEREWELVVGMVDAILDAAEGQRGAAPLRQTSTPLQRKAARYTRSRGS